MKNNHEFVFEAYYTQRGLAFIKKMDLSKVQKVTLDLKCYNELPYIVKFHFVDGDVVAISNALSAGYRGEGPWAFHDVLVAMGVSEEEAAEVFEKRLHYEFQNPMCSG